MNELRCPQCGAPVDAGATECKYCGFKNAQKIISAAIGKS